MRSTVTTFIALSVLCLMSQVSISTAAESGSALKADTIRAEPFVDAKAVGQLSAGTKVSIVKRDGAWYQISSPKKGWVRMLSIRKGAAASGASASGATALATGRAGTGKVVASTGVRGLNEEDLKSAKFDEEEVKLAESYEVSKEDAGKFAKKAKLKARKVDYLSE